MTRFLHYATLAFAIGAQHGFRLQYPLGNAEWFIYDPWHWALEAVHRFAITDSLLKAIGLRLVSSYSEPRRKPHRLDTNSPLPDPKSFHEKAGLLRDAIRSQCLTCSRHKKRSPGFSSPDKGACVYRHSFTWTKSRLSVHVASRPLEASEQTTVSKTVVHDCGPETSAWETGAPPIHPALD